MQGTSTQTTSKVTRSLLTCGIIAAPIYTVVGLIQIFTREGFDITRHSLSLLSNGDLGWIQISNFLVTGLLTIAGALGIRRALAGGRGRTWGPLLVGVYGLGLICAGLLVADPALGFPPGTPDGPPVELTPHGLGHFVAGGVGFLALIAACFVLARRFAGLGERGWATYSVATGVLFFAGFFGIAAGNQIPGVSLVFAVAVVIGWGWVSAVSARAMVK